MPVAALVLVVVLAVAGCGEAAGARDSADSPDSGSAWNRDDQSGTGVAAPERGRADRPVVELPDRGSAGFLDPDAEPSTALGRLRAQHLPVWTPDFDWAFPPEACDTAWELDAVAEPAPSADIAVLGDFAVAAALTVMRYEHQLSRALADPSALAQLCVAAASVDPARAEALDVLASNLGTGARRSEPAAYPLEVQLVAVTPAGVLAVACVEPGHPAVVGADGQVLEPEGSAARLQAYLLSLSRGLEDRVIDVSYRVSNTAHRPAPDCNGLDAWTTEWRGHVEAWMDEGQIWEPLDTALSAAEICASPPPEGPGECPHDWPR